MLRGAIRFFVFSACIVTLIGCAEIDRRGGVVAQVEDWVLFRAVTKSHRLLRSYALAGSLIAVARNTPSINAAEKKAIAGRLQGVLQLAQEAYFCLYPDRYTDKWDEIGKDPSKLTALKASAINVGEYPPVDSCIFFVGRMAELDYAL